MMANKIRRVPRILRPDRHIIAVQIPGAIMLCADLLPMPPAPSHAVDLRQFEAALHSLARLAYDVPPRILITGSLYLAGHVLSANGTPPG